jgi:hypothetical protein
MAIEVCYQLEVDPEAVVEAWKSPRGAQDKFNQFLQANILTQLRLPLLLAVDEADRLLESSYKPEFFDLVKAWDSLRALDPPIWRNLNLAMVISTHPYLRTDDTSQLPFNVGMTINLQDFDERQVSELNRRYGSPFTRDTVLAAMDLLGGHPFLMHQALYTVIHQKLTWAELARAAITDNGPFGEHLQLYRDELKNHAELVKPLRQVIGHRSSPDHNALYRLVAAGLVKEEAGAYRCRCKLYEMYFTKSLG